MNAARTRLVLAGGVLLAAIAVPIVLGAVFPGMILDLLNAAMSAGAAFGVAGWACLVLAQTLVATVGILPASLIGVAAGAFYGPGLGFALATAGTLLGAGASFAIGRSWLRPHLAGWVSGGRRLAAIDRMIVADGWKAVGLIRLSPILPFAPTSFALSLTTVHAGAYAIGTLAALPGLFVCVLTGAAGRSGVLAATGGTAWLSPILLGIGIAATLGLTMRLRSALGPFEGAER